MIPLARLVRGDRLTVAEARDLVAHLCDPDVSALQKAAALTAMATRGETADELRGLATGLRALAVEADFGRVADTCGTGGDGRNTLNLSTAAALVVAAAGIRVAKHGNRAASGRCGSADVLERLGVALPSPTTAGPLLRETRFTFLFAPAFHPAMAALGPIRRELGVRTPMNLLGPLVNPAAPALQLVGACDLRVAALLAGALAGMPIERAFVVHGDGFDEATPVGPFVRFDVRPGRIDEALVDPLDYGFPRCDPADLVAENPAADLVAALAGDRPASPAIALNAALVLELDGLAPRDAAALATETMRSGRALSLLDDVVARSRGVPVG